MTREELIADYLAYKWLPGGRFAGVMPLTFGRGRICVSPAADLLSVSVAY